MKVENTIDIYKEDGDYADGKKMIISSHWNRDNIIKISFDGKSCFVSVNDLEKAIDNASNHISYR